MPCRPQATPPNKPPHLPSPPINSGQVFQPIFSDAGSCCQSHCTQVRAQIHPDPRTHLTMLTRCSSRALRTLAMAAAASSASSS